MDGVANRTSQTQGGVTTTAFQFAGSQVLTEKQGSTTTGTYTWGSGLTRRNGEYPLMDGLGSERVVRDSANAQTGSVVYDAFGQTVSTSGSSANPYMFAANSGYRNDGDAGLMQVGARYYDPMTGRFLTRDTVLSQHPYVYCGGDPVNALDPTGHMEWWEKTIDLGGTIIAVGGIVAWAGGPPGVEASIPIIGIGGVVFLIGVGGKYLGEFIDDIDWDRFGPGDGLDGFGP